MSLFSSLKPKAQLSRNVFDRSRTDTFSTKLGILTPCFVEHTVPDGKYKIDVSDIVRLNSQVTANFVGFNQVVDFFFVPYSQIWRSFNKFYNQKGDDTRMLTSSPVISTPAYVPTFSLKTLVTDIWYHIYWFEFYQRAYDYITQNNGPASSDLLNWAMSKGVLYDGSGNYGNEYVDIHGRFCGYDILRNLDMLGYGNFLPALKFALVPFYNLSQSSFMSSYINPLIASPSDNGAAIEQYCTTEINKIVSSLPDTSPNVFSIMSYLKVFNDIYMNRIYPENHLEMYYNVDYNTGLSVNSVSLNIIREALKPRFRQYKKDMFTGLYPDPQFGNVSIASTNHESLIQLKGNSQTTLSNVGVSQTSHGSYLIQDVSPYNKFTWNITSNISALAIRQSLAFQKYKEALLRAGNREDDLQRAIFGVGSKYIENKYCEFLGSFQSSVQMNPVAATTEGAGQNIGDLGAYAVGSIGMGSQKEISFDAYDFGVIIGVCYIMPDTKYEAFGIDAQNVKFEQDDYFNPKLQNLGLRPVYSYLANSLGIGNNAPVPSVLGYLAEYFEYKTAVSKVHGEFFGSNPIIPLQYDSIGGYDPSIYLKVAGSSFGGFSEYVAPRDVRDVSLGTKQMLYIAPWDADRVFNTSERPQQLYDHFKFEMTFRVKAVLPMSVVGLPQ